MPDKRFFDSRKKFALKQLAEIAGCELNDASHAKVRISDVAPLDIADHECITFLSNPKYRAHLKTSKAGACIIEKKDLKSAPKDMPLLFAEDSYVAFAKIASAFYPNIEHPRVDDRFVEVATSASLGKDVHVGLGAIIGDYAIIGDRTEIGANSFIGPGVIIGKDCIIAANTTITHAIIGNHVHLHTGVRVGQRGFGFAATTTGEYIDIPQLGRVIIGNNVEIGANSCVDRGTGPDTIIGDRCRIDNLVQIAHNVVLGQGCILAAQTGIAGSTKVGNYVVMGGKVGIAGHLTIGDNVQLAASSGVMRDIPSGSKYGGAPAMPIRDWHRMNVALKKLSLPPAPKKKTKK